MIKIEPKHFEIIKQILAKYPYDFYAFGSRVNGKPRRLSDLDLCYFDKIPWATQAQLANDFEESDLPYSVDLVDWNRIDDSFKDKIRSELICIQKHK